MIIQGFPSEAELLEDYRKVAELMAPFPVTIRILAGSHEQG